jgi:hypothetical protein
MIEGILNTIKNMPYSEVQELLTEIEKLPKKDGTGTPQV